MVDINELLEIISSLSGSASIDEIASTYAKKYKMPVSLVPKWIVNSKSDKNYKVRDILYSTGDR